MCTSYYEYVQLSIFQLYSGIQIRPSLSVLSGPQVCRLIMLPLACSQNLFQPVFPFKCFIMGKQTLCEVSFELEQPPPGVTTGGEMANLVLTR